MPQTITSEDDFVPGPRDFPSYGTTRAAWVVVMLRTEKFLRSDSVTVCRYDVHARNERGDDVKVGTLKEWVYSCVHSEITFEPDEDIDENIDPEVLAAFMEYTGYFCWGPYFWGKVVEDDFPRVPRE